MEISIFTVGIMIMISLLPTLLIVMSTEDRLQVMPQDIFQLI